MFEMMVIITLLIVINFLVAFARTLRKKWIRFAMMGVAAFLLIPTFLFVLRMFMKG